jgi:cytochrome c-type biogenesis protein CcmH
MTDMTSMLMNRRRFLGSIGSIAATTALAARVVVAQEAGGSSATMQQMQGMDMDQGAYKPVKLPPKSNAKPVLTNDQRDDLEHHLHCQCGCGLDIYTCRTTDFSCHVSPRMHADVMGLVAGGYGASEILAVFRKVYGERVLMEPVKEGFNWVGYILPFGVLAAGAVLVSRLVRQWSRPAPAAAGATQTISGIDATPDELKRLDQVLRNDE